MSETKWQELAAKLQHYEDIEAIKALKAKYLRLVDSKQWADWAELLTEDCRLDSEAGVQEGREQIVSVISNSMQNGTTVHRVTAPEITITGPDTASGIWAMLDVVAIEFNGQTHSFRGFGYYYEDYVRTASGWRMKSGKLVRQRVIRD